MKARIEDNKVRVYTTLPTRWVINGIPYNLRTLDNSVLESEGFFDVVIPVITEHQELIPFEPTDLVDNQFVQRVRDFTAEEIAVYEDNKIENTVNTLLDVRTNDGIEYFRKVRNFFKRKYDDGIITGTQFKNIRATLSPALQPLKDGDWDLAQDNINAITRPSGGLGDLYDKIKTDIDNYVLANY